jgi:nucleotide-binding universal stress UspA family protein
VAGEEARRLGARIEAVTALEPLGPWVDLSSATLPDGSQLRAEARSAADRLVTEVLGPDDADRPAVEVVVEEGQPATVLTGRAADADLLVVGSRGRATLPGLVLGSVALRCVVHAPCPVMVVHPAPAGSADPVAGRMAAGRA